MCSIYIVLCRRAAAAQDGCGHAGALLVAGVCGIGPRMPVTRDASSPSTYQPVAPVDLPSLVLPAGRVRRGPCTAPPTQSDCQSQDSRLSTVHRCQLGWHGAAKGRRINVLSECGIGYGPRQPELSVYQMPNIDNMQSD
eukprot:SAG31_NODE_7498_length_1672_cov_8.695486_1_plen_139_part_00